MNDSSKGSLIGASLLISGCCIGAGMLGLPVLTALAGFGPSSLILLLSWLFMLTTGLLLLEANLWFRDEVSIVTIAKRTLGKTGQWLSWGIFLFLFYCVLVAYVTASGKLLADFGLNFGGREVSPWVGSLLFCSLLATLICVGTGAVDHFNRWLMLGLVAAYGVLLVFGASHVQAAQLRHSNWQAALFALPVAVFSFGYHNLIPSVSSYLNYDKKKLTLSVLCGSAIPLIVYLLWEWLILGIVHIEGLGGLRETLSEGNLATHALKETTGSPWVVIAAHSFAFFAVVTSFLSVALSFVDFLADGLQLTKTRKNKSALSLLTFAPPFLIALSYPDIFLLALNYASAFGAVILFGIFPALMVWRGRYSLKLSDQKIVPGGRFTLAAIILFSVAVAAIQLFAELS